MNCSVVLKEGEVDRPKLATSIQL